MDSKHYGLSRRNMIKAAALAPLSAVRGSAANSAVTVGLIGSGGRGVRVAGYLARDKRARLVAVSDLVDERMARAQKTIPAEGAKTYKNFHDLLASDVDAVIIATPVYLHPEHLEAAVKAGKHIYIEKPAGADIAGCKQVLSVADRADRKLNISFGFQQRYGSGYKKAKKLFDSGELGKLHMVHFHWIKGATTGEQDPVPRPTTDLGKLRDWKRWRETYGDIIVETYCHGIDVVNWFLGQHPSKAHGSGGRTIRRDGDVMDHCDVTFDYENKVQACLTGSQIAPRFYRVVNEQFLCASGVIETAREYWKQYRDGNDVKVEESPRDITIDAVEEFVTRIVENRPENTGVSAAESTLTAHMAQMAIDLKREVTWEEVMRSA